MKHGLAVLGVIAACLMTAACGGGGGGDSSAATATGTTATTTTGSTMTTTTTPTTPVTPVLANFTSVTIDAGPAALAVGANAYTASNSPYVSVTLCAPGSATNCQTIDHVLLDTGSVGLRVFASVINTSVLNGLTNETDNNANPVGACYGYVDGYVFGSVRQADFTIGGETVANMPFLAIADTTAAFVAVPRTCSSGGGTNLKTVQLFGANGVLGIGVTATDCGSACTGTGSSGTAIYYDCPATGCSAVVGRSANTSAPFQQLPNPVAAMSVDNNGSILTFPGAAAAGQATLTGTLYFGIGTQTNNALGSATVLTTTGSGSSGAGYVSISANNVNFPQSYIDSGSNGFYFVDKTIPTCTGKNFTGYYCPTASIPENPTIKGSNGATATAPFTLNNAQTLFANGSFAVFPGVGGNPAVFSNFTGASSSYDLGVAFFFGRRVYTAIEGRNAGGTNGPYFAY